MKNALKWFLVFIIWADIFLLMGLTRIESDVTPFSVILMIALVLAVLQFRLLNAH